MLVSRLPMTLMGDRIRRIRKGRGQTQADFAAALGVTQTTVSKWEAGLHEPDFDQARRLAEIVGESVEQFLGTVNPASISLAGIHVIGSVQAGLWTEATVWSREDWYLISVPTAKEYERFRRFGLEVRGSSVDQVFPDRSVVECVLFVDLEDEPRHKDFVVVERTRTDGKIEATVKQFMIAPDGSGWLWPRSSDPSFSPFPAVPAAEDQADIETVAITALVTGFYRSLTRGSPRP